MSESLVENERTINKDDLIELTNNDFYSSDVNHIISVCRGHGYKISYDVAKKAWQEYSLGGWMELLPDEYLTDYILIYTKEIQKE